MRTLQPGFTATVPRDRGGHTVALVLKWSCVADVSTLFNHNAPPKDLRSKDRKRHYYVDYTTRYLLVY
jgi:hypothetical protein